MVPKCKKFIREVSGPLMFCSLHGCTSARKIYWEHYPVYEVNDAGPVTLQLTRKTCLIFEKS